MTTVLGMTSEGRLMHKIGNDYYRYTKLNKEELKLLNILVNEGLATVIKKGIGYTALVKLTEQGKLISNEC
ncbi:hypothetical protein CN692_00200 [Bacillus sp. AFS002410]|uniref:hypothetical protein n=1 Tax=Bacillus sp. AFS002410 TaxID=2033481 RepID=UPI000BF16FCD|nr:hypothetical protein [Bacillus sp. AFS002410]PEJ60547.1 hypothetical protein CN692_00200 [Bacillus sp. AFS002410]